MGKKKKKKKALKLAKKRSSKALPAAPSLSALSYRAIEREILRLTDLLDRLKRKSSLVRRSLAYLEREQRRVARQINDARKFLRTLKNRGMKALRNVPEAAEELYRQLKYEFNRLSRRLTS